MPAIMPVVLSCLRPWLITAIVCATAVAQTVRDTEGRAVRPLDAKVAVLLFARTDCPISNRYAPKVHQLYGRFASGNVRFWLVYVDPQQPVDLMRQHMRDYGYRFKALMDPSHELVKRAGVRATPEAAVFVAGRLVYRGRIDDRYVSPGKTRPSATRNDLADVLDAVAAGGTVNFRETKAVGCLIADLR